MTDCLVFNHHSLPFDHADIAERAVPDFLKTCIEAKNAGLGTILADQKVDRFWYRLELAPGFFWQNWYDRHQDDEHRDIIRAFRSIATQSPFFNVDDIADGADLFEASLNGCKNYSAVSAAAWHESPLVSFATRDPWNISPLSITITRLNLTTTEIENKDAEIQNFYSHAILSGCLPDLLRRRNAALRSGKEVVDGFGELYPAISLCGKAPQQLNNWSSSLTVLEQVKESLTVLNDFSSRWKDNQFVEYRNEFLRALGLSFQVSGESQTVRDNPRLRREREFWLPRGNQEFFELHVKISFGYRLHFFPDSEVRQIYVGYIGPHLRLK